MQNLRSEASGVRYTAVALLLTLGFAGCGRPPAPAPRGTGATAQPRTIVVVRVVEQPLNVMLSLPAELTPYQTVALYPKVTGFVKTIRVDRGCCGSTAQTRII